MVYALTISTDDKKALPIPYSLSMPRSKMAVTVRACTVACVPALLYALHHKRRHQGKVAQLPSPCGRMVSGVLLQPIHRSHVKRGCLPQLGSQDPKCYYLGAEILHGIQQVSHCLLFSRESFRPLNIKDTHLFVPIFPAHHSFLHFALGHLHFQFVDLPFGLSSEPWVFTMTLVSSEP